MIRFLLVSAVASLATAQPAQSLTIEATVGGGALEGPGVRYLNFNGPVLGNSEVNVILEGFATAVTGFDTTHAPPFVSGSNHDNFDTPFVEGLDQSQYLQSSHAALGMSPTNPVGSSITFAFSSPQDYFGLLWGSIDPYNNFAFYLGGKEIITLSGDDVVPTADGSQLIGGTSYVNFTNIQFDQVVIWSDNFSFEFDNVAYRSTVGVPDGGMTVALLGLSMGALSLICRRIIHASPARSLHPRASETDPLKRRSHQMK